MLGWQGGVGGSIGDCYFEGGHWILLEDINYRIQFPRTYI